MADPFAQVKQYFSTVDGVVVNAGRGSQGLKFGKKLFVMFYQAQLVVKLSPARVAEVVASGDGQPFDPGTGSPMADRVLIPESRRELWIQYCQESHRAAAG